MNCKKCKAEIPDDSVFCLKCGMKQTSTKKPKSRGNGQGSVYQLPNKKWKVRVTLGYILDLEGKVHRQCRSKEGFRTKKEALDYIPILLAEPKRVKTCTLQQLYDKWEPTHTAGKSTMDCYRAAFKWMRPLHMMKMDDIDIDDLQEVMDSCGAGKRTKQNMKALIGLLYKFAIPRRMADMNLGQYLVIRDGKAAEEREALPMEAVEKLKKVIGIVPYADYIVAQCYLGFRPSEFLALDCMDYDRQNRAIMGGAKTDAGKDRLVTISPKIQPIIDSLTANKIAGPIFCAPDGNAMRIKVYRAAFYAALDAIGWENPDVEINGTRRKKYTPHSCRHTFATMMKEVQAPDKDKLKLIGHTSEQMLRKYQSVDLESLRKITDAF